jgi:hypothetical protein
MAKRLFRKSEWETCPRPCARRAADRLKADFGFPPCD